MGTVSGKYIVVAILVVTAIVVTIAAVMLFGHPKGDAAPPPSVAVLPVAGDSTGEITHQIIEALKPIPNFQVADAAMNKDSPIRMIGQKLNVRTVLEGSVDPSGIKVKLFNAADEFELWSHTYPRDANFPAALARDVAAQIK
jgi:TolB-like protein